MGSLPEETASKREQEGRDPSSDCGPCSLVGDIRETLANDGDGDGDKDTEISGSSAFGIVDGDLVTTGGVEGKGISAGSVSPSSTLDPVSATSSVSSSGSSDSEETSERNECVTSSDSPSARTVSTPTSPSSGETSTNEELVDDEVISYRGSFTCGVWTFSHYWGRVCLQWEL